MSYQRFLKDLFAEGRVIAPEIAPLTEAELQSGDAVIAEYEQIHRLEFPGIAPPFVASAGRWAATRLFRSSQFAVYRDADAAKLNEVLSLPFPETVTPGMHYSIDLVFRYLPDLERFARSVAEGDPLVGHLQRWAKDWPLSSVGMSGIEDLDVGGLVTDENLMRLYADRIIASGDKSRLTNAAVRDAVKQALGMYPEMAPKLASALSSDDERNST